MIRFLLAAPFIVFAVYMTHSCFKYTRMISNIFLGLKYKPLYESASSTKGEKISILDSGDHEIEAILVERKNADKLVIFCHDSGSAKESWEKYAYFFPKMGFSVLSIDFISVSAEPAANPLSQWPAEEDVQKLLLAIHWAKKAFRPDIKIILFGVSKGADIALAASAREKLVRGVIADGLFSMREIFRDYIRKWAPILVKPNLFGDNYPAWVVNLFTNLGFWYCQKKSKKKFVDVEKLLKTRRMPLLMIHGEEDDYIPHTHQRFLHRLVGDRRESERFVVPQAGHNQGVLLDRETYESKVAGFLKKAIVL